MSTSPYVRDVDAAQFDAEVIERSHEVPVLVDFWAPWCGPCRALGPNLVRLAEEFAGAFEVAKVDTDANPELAARYRVQGIPYCKLFHHGRDVAEFVGALPAPELRKWLQAHVPTPADDRVREGLLALEAGEFDAAGAKLRAALELAPGHVGARIGLAKLALAQGDAAAVRGHLGDIPDAAPEAETAQAVLAAAALIDACAAIGGPEVARERLLASEDDLDAHLALGACLAGRGKYRDSLEHLLQVVMRDRKHRDGAAHKAMLTVFTLAGRFSDVSDEYKRRLQIYL